MALGLSRAGTKTVKHALETLDSLAAAKIYVYSRRVLYGAYQNRLEYTYNNLQNTEAADSQIRDTDMAAKMVKKGSQCLQFNINLVILVNQNVFRSIFAALF